MTHPATILINVQAPLYDFDGQLYLDDQACNGLRRWADNFDHVTAMIPVRVGKPPPHYVLLRQSIASHADKILIERLPWSYRPDHFIRDFLKTRRKIRKLISGSYYLRFSIGSAFFGDWGAVACRESSRMKRRYAVWTDRVESQVIRASIGQGPWRGSVQARLFHRPMAALEKAIVRRASLGLFHGSDTYEAYAPYCSNSHVVHNIHISKNDHLMLSDLQLKQASCLNGPLKICYVGRISPMKGPFDWVATMESLKARGVDFEASWFGSGSEEDSVRERIRETNLQDRVRFPGFLSNRAAVLDEIRKSHLMLFCHKTPESPRCLIEALLSGTPIVGYDSPYPRDLIKINGGGILTPPNDVQALSDVVASLAVDRSCLAQLIGLALKDGSSFDDVSVFKHRSDLIKTHL